MTRPMKRVLLLVLALSILLTTGLPAAFAAEAVENADGFRFSRKTLVLYVGEIYDMSSFIQPTQKGDTIDKSRITYRSSNTRAVPIGKNTGTAIGQRIGSSVITASIGGRKATIRLIVRRNKLDNLFGGRPSVSFASAYNFKLRLKSIEITTPNTVVCEYYLAFNFPRSYRTTYFSRFDALIKAFDTYFLQTKDIVDGSPRSTVNVRCYGQQVAIFKVTFTGSSVKHTNISLPKSGGDNITSSWDVYLNWKY